MDEAPSITVDARGHRCPTPTLRLRRALERIVAGAEIVLLADDPMARIDVPHFLAEGGHALVERREEGGVLSFRVRKAAAPPGADRDAPPA